MLAEFASVNCNSKHGIDRALWAMAQDPIKTAGIFVDPFHKISESAAEFRKDFEDSIFNGFQEYLNEFKTLYEKFDQMSPQERGELIGYTIGQHGIGIFAGGASLKTISAFRSLQKANSLCNLEAMAFSKANREKFISVATEHCAKRDAYFKNIKYNFDATCFCS